MTKRNRSRSGANHECPCCKRKLRGEKGLSMHIAEAHSEHEALINAARLVERELSAFDRISANPSREYEMWRAERAAVELLVTKALLAAGSTLREEGSDASIKLCGLRATSTCGLSGALSNWLMQARAKLEAEA